MNIEPHFSSNKQDWGTPQKFFNCLDSEFHFTLDPCASEWNAKCKRYYTYDQNGLIQSWDNEVIFCNPPYNEVGKWIEKASKTKALTVVLTFARTDVKWWHTWVYDKTINRFRDNVEVRFIQGRLKFENQYGKTNPAPTPSCLIIFHNNN